MMADFSLLSWVFFVFFFSPAARRCRRDGAGEVRTAEETLGKHPGAARRHKRPSGQNGS